MNCARNGCTGTIVDGYCDVCGMAPARPAATPAATATPTPTPTPTPTSTPAPSSLTASTLGSLRRATTGRTRASARAHLGAGLVQIEPVPFRDPAEAALEAVPVVPESRRFCSDCGEPVGRGSDGVPGRTSGFCRKCGTQTDHELWIQVVAPDGHFLGELGGEELRQGRYVFPAFAQRRQR